MAKLNARADVVSPPTRGWTFSSRGMASNHIGFPAHAGMDHTHVPRNGVAAWFPRPRGDGPTMKSTGPVYFLVSPPTRGWTCRCEQGTQTVTGFPAHAGMDLV